MERRRGSAGTVGHRIRCPGSSTGGSTLTENRAVPGPTEADHEQLRAFDEPGATSSGRPALPEHFFDRPALEVAPELLGALVVSRSQRGVTAVRITEVEAYEGPDDPASHAFQGPNRTNRAEFGAPGTFYVYRTHAVHRCLNAVCGPGRRPASVLLRAGTVVEGTDAAQERRGPGVRPRDLARGPANLARALGIADLRHDGQSACDAAGDLFLAEPTGGVASARVGRGPRTGVGGPAASYPWRFWMLASRASAPIGRTRGPAGGRGRGADPSALLGHLGCRGAQRRPKVRLRRPHPRPRTPAACVPRAGLRRDRCALPIRFRAGGDSRGPAPDAPRIPALT
ncbi:DNA-3-methyladenine glycosylase [Streptomyces flaveolus]|uniref:DNA-3-methyladenine glycosylase n=1 Tax=Streptomyces flaveolus TaxID=67297 RepID=UPI00344027B9